MEKEEGHTSPIRVMGISTSNRVGNETSFNSSSSNVSVSKTKSDENIRDTFQSIMGLVNVSKNQSQGYSSSAGADKSKLTSSNSSSSKSKTASNSTSAYEKESQQYKTDNKTVDRTADKNVDKSVDNTKSSADASTNKYAASKTENKYNSKKAADSKSKVTDSTAADYTEGDMAAEEMTQLQGEVMAQLLNVNADEAIDASSSVLADSEITDDAAVTDLSDIAAQIVEDVAEILNVPVEEVQQSMENIDIGVGDLLDADNVKNLVLDVKNASNIDMLVDESLGQAMENISELVSQTVAEIVENSPELETNIAERLNLAQDIAEPETAETVTEFNAGKTKAEDTAGDKKALVQTSDATENPVEIKDETQDIQQSREGRAGLKEDKAADGKTEERQNISDTPKEVNPEPAKTVTDVKTEQKTTETTEGSFAEVSETNQSQTSSDNQGFANQGRQGDSLDSSLIGNLTQALTDAVSQSGEVSEFDGDVEAADIVRQVVDEIKTNINDRVRSLEVRLNPENLGRVQITVSTKNGVMQARIIAENEAAKNAIEGSLSLLKETFNEQNLKVEAVEVTIANYDFFKEESEPENNENKQKNTSSRGNKEAINDDIVREEVSDAEQLEQDMMQQSGNSVSYAV